MGRVGFGSHLKRWWPGYTVIVVLIIAIAYFAGCFSSLYHKKVETTPAAGNSDYVDVMYPANLAELLNTNRLVKDQNGKIIGITFEALRELLQNDLAQKIKDDVALQDLLRGPQGDSGSSYQVAGSGGRGQRGAPGPKGDRGERGLTGAQGPAGEVNSAEVERLVGNYLKSVAVQQLIASSVAKSIKITKQSSQKIRVPQTITIDVERTDDN